MTRTFARPPDRLAGSLIATLVLLGAPRDSMGQAPVEPAEEHAASEAPASVLFLRPHAGLGGASRVGDDRHGLATHAGGRLLMPAFHSEVARAKWGFEATYLDLDVSRDEAFSQRYLVVGVLLEMTLFGHFNADFGTLGYLGLGQGASNPFGLMTNLGWEPQWDSPVVPFVTLRSEWIFDEPLFMVMSLSAGVTFNIRGRASPPKAHDQSAATEPRSQP